MSQRLNYSQLAAASTQKLFELSAVTKKQSIDAKLLALVEIRASQINGCTFCVDMHVKQAKIHEERELRLHHIAVWRESNLFSPKERAALEWTEAVTKLDSHGISDGIYGRTREFLSEQELADLTFILAVINSWNRLAVSFKSQHGALDQMMGLTKAGLT